MNIKKYLCCGLIACLALIFSASSIANGSEQDEKAVKAMALILSHVNHFPSAAEKKTLKNIANDSNNSDQVKTIANAMYNMQHSVSSGDKSKLKAISGDSSVDDDIRDLAKILSHFNHKPSGSDVKKLKDIAD